MIREEIKKQMIEAMKAGQKEKVEEISKLLLDQAKIAEGEAITNPSFYTEKMGEYILKAI